MQANTVQKRLASLPSLSRAGKRVNGLARLLASRTLMDASVNRTRGNRGTATPGIDGETLDGLTIERINGWVRGMVEGTYRAKPVKRVFIPKANGKPRPLGIPTYADRMVQDAQRDILQRIYEPVFSRDSHGFRPGRSCQTALQSVQEYWTGTKWFVEVDIKGFFDNIDHDVLLDLLRERIDDEAFIATIRAQLRAGVMEDLAEGSRNGGRKGRWQYRPSYSGTPQGGIVSPILANIYLHELDEFMAAEIETFNRGRKRRWNPLYKRAENRATRLRRRVKALEAEGAGTDHPGRHRLIAEVKGLARTMWDMPSGDPMDPNYRRLTYIRYADDFLIGVIGSKAEAAAVLEKVRAFLKDTLHLDVSEDKTGIVKATEGARFLGYDIRTRESKRITKTRHADFVSTRRGGTGRVMLSIPTRKLRGFCNKHGYGEYDRCKGTHRGDLIHSSDYEITSIYNAELRGFANYYRLDHRVKTRVNKLAWVANQSLMKTLARKHKTRVGAILRELRRPNGRDVVEHTGRGGKTLEVTVWRPKDIENVGAASPRAEVDRVPLGATLAKGRTDVTDRLLAGGCENVSCTSPPGTPIQVHHVRALAADRRPSFVEWLVSARNRKTRYLCIHCHRSVHAEARRKRRETRTESRMPGKLARPVRGGGTSRPAHRKPRNRRSER